MLAVGGFAAADLGFDRSGGVANRRLDVSDDDEGSSLSGTSPRVSATDGRRHGGGGRRHRRSRREAGVGVLGRSLGDPVHQYPAAALFPRGSARLTGGSRANDYGGCFRDPVAQLHHLSETVRTVEALRRLPHDVVEMVLDCALSEVVLWAPCGLAGLQHLIDCPRVRSVDLAGRRLGGHCLASDRPPLVIRRPLALRNGSIHIVVADPDARADDAGQTRLDGVASLPTLSPPRDWIGSPPSPALGYRWGAINDDEGTWQGGKGYLGSPGRGAPLVSPRSPERRAGMDEEDSAVTGPVPAVVLIEGADTRVLMRGVEISVAHARQFPHDPEAPWDAGDTAPYTDKPRRAAVVVRGGARLDLRDCALRGAAAAQPLVPDHPHSVAGSLIWVDGDEGWASQLRATRTQLAGAVCDGVLLTAGGEASLVDCVIDDCLGAAVRCVGRDERPPAAGRALAPRALALALDVPGAAPALASASGRPSRAAIAGGSISHCYWALCARDGGEWWAERAVGLGPPPSLEAIHDPGDLPLDGAGAEWGHLEGGGDGGEGEDPAGGVGLVLGELDLDA